MMATPAAMSVSGGSAPVDGSSSGAGSASGGEGGSIHTGKPPAATYQSPLTAGQVDDNAKFSEYRAYLSNYRGAEVHPVDESQRLFVRVTDSSQHPVAGARVQLFDGSTRVFDGQTVSDGRVLFLPGSVGLSQATSLHATVSRGNASVEDVLKLNGTEQSVTLANVQDNSGPVMLDLVFLLDATGSMDDEINQIKATVGSIAQRIEQLPGSSKPRFGLVAYRDLGDDFVTRSFDFANVEKFSANLDTIYAGGGGDMPESVNAGLHEALNLPGWTDNSSGRHLRMIVLVGDAPPHLDYANDYEYTSLLQQAVQRGIKIFPIGASGLDDQGEYIFRQFAQVTQGQFVFLTYANGVSGAPGPATDHQVSNFTVQQLDTLVVNLVAGEIANQTGNEPQAQSQVVPVEVAETVFEDSRPHNLSNTLLADAEQLLGKLFNWGTLFWIALLAVLIFVGYRAPQKARVAVGKAAEAPNTEATTAEPDTLGDIVVPAGDEEYVPQYTVNLRGAELYPTVPLPSRAVVERELAMASTSSRE